jgi:hypothetical protein
MKVDFEFITMCGVPREPGSALPVSRSYAGRKQLVPDSTLSRETVYFLATRDRMGSMKKEESEEVRKLLLALGVIKPPRKPRATGPKRVRRPGHKTWEQVEREYLAEQEHPPTGYPCQICGKVINKFHKGVQESVPDESPFDADGPDDLHFPY